jgi:hypothetical protein
MGVSFRVFHSNIPPIQTGAKGVRARRPPKYRL